MKRWVGLGILASGLAGCQVNRSPSDPFMRTTVPPPATGQVVPPPADGYYTPSPGVTVAPGTATGPSTFVAPPPAAAPLSQGAASAAPASPPAYYNAPPPTSAPGALPPSAMPPAAMPPAAMPPAGAPPANRYQPQGGFNFQQTSTSPAGAPGPAVRLVAANVPAAAAGGAASSVSMGGAPLTASFVTTAAKGQGAADESDLAGSAASPQGSTGVIAASYSEPVAEAASTDASAANASASAAAADSDTVVSSSPLPIPATAAASTIRIVGTASEGVPVAEAGTGEAANPAESADDADPRLRMTANQPVPEITDLPQSAAAAPPKAYGAPRSRLVFNSPAGSSSPAAAINAAAASPTGASVAHSVQRPPGVSRSYGVDGNYETLHGRLEYSQSSRQWKLRYIPIDGQTDQYGGSVVLPDDPALDALQPGDFVIASGRVASAAARSGGFSPQYDLDQLLPQ